VRSLASQSLQVRWRRGPLDHTRQLQYGEHQILFPGHFTLSISRDQSIRVPRLSLLTCPHLGISSLQHRHRIQVNSGFHEFAVAQPFRLRVSCHPSPHDPLSGDFSATCFAYVLSIIKERCVGHIWIRGFLEGLKFFPCASDNSRFLSLTSHPFQGASTSTSRPADVLSIHVFHIRGFGFRPCRVMQCPLESLESQPIHATNTMLVFRNFAYVHNHFKEYINPV